MNQPNSNQAIKVWDWSIRVFHWSLPVLIFLMWFFQDQGEMERHILIKWSASALISSLWTDTRAQRWG